MSIILALYYTSILMFGFVNSTIAYCLLLVFNALCCLGLIILISGFSWYGLLLYIVYVGGIYVLFIFVSVHLPNNMGNGANNVNFLSFTLFIFWEVTNNIISLNLYVNNQSYNFCSFNEGISYVLISLVIVLCFILVSFISSSKESFIR